MLLAVVLFSRAFVHMNFWHNGCIINSLHMN
jgi:hypothetical protein